MELPNSGMRIRCLPDGNRYTSKCTTELYGPDGSTWRADETRMYTFTIVSFSFEGNVPIVYLRSAVCSPNGTSYWTTLQTVGYAHTSVRCVYPTE